jgi:hypothetical protein
MRGLMLSIFMAVGLAGCGQMAPEGDPAGAVSSSLQSAEQKASGGPATENAIAKDPCAGICGDVNNPEVEYNCSCCRAKAKNSQDQCRYL